jgi:hypothetical protein
MIDMTHQIMSSETRNSRWGWLCKIGGVSALITGALLLIGMINLIVSVLQPRTANGWLSLLTNNWLVKIFILHAEFSDIHADLHGLNLLDIFILLLVSVICLSISTIFRNARKVWSLIAFALSVIAIILFLATQVAGRSTVMLAVLILSFVMLRDKTFNKATIYTGILASVFLFVGDLTVGVHSNIITILFSIGYALLITWFFLIAQSLFRLGHMS